MSVDVVTGPRTHVTLYPTHYTFTLNIHTTVHIYTHTHTHTHTKLYMPHLNVRHVSLCATRNGVGAAIDVGHVVELLLLGDIQEAESRQVPLERKERREWLMLLQVLGHMLLSTQHT